MATIAGVTDDHIDEFANRFILNHMIIIENDDEMIGHMLHLIGDHADDGLQSREGIGRLFQCGESLITERGELNLNGFNQIREEGVRSIIELIKGTPRHWEIGVVGPVEEQTGFAITCRRNNRDELSVDLRMKVID